jgi:hypothetical protein
MWPLPSQGIELSGSAPGEWRSGWPFITTSGRFYFRTSSESQYNPWEAFRNMGDNSSVPLDLNNPRDGWIIAQRGPDVFWLPTHVRRVIHVNVCLPLWFLLAVAAGYPGWVIGSWLSKRRERKQRRQAGHCRRCGYDLTGNMSGVCPECGGRIQDDK